MTSPTSSTAPILFINPNQTSSPRPKTPPMSLDIRSHSDVVRSTSGAILLSAPSSPKSPNAPSSPLKFTAEVLKSARSAPAVTPPIELSDDQQESPRNYLQLALKRGSQFGDDVVADLVKKAADLEAAQTIARRRTLSQTSLPSLTSPVGDFGGVEGWDADL